MKYTWNLTKESLYSRSIESLNERKLKGKEIEELKNEVEEYREHILVFLKELQSDEEGTIISSGLVIPFNFLQTEDGSIIEYYVSVITGMFISQGIMTIMVANGDYIEVIE